MIPASKTEAFYFKKENKQTLNSKKGRDGSIKDTEKRFIWDALRDWVIFVQFKKLNKHPWRSVTFETCKLTVALRNRWFSRFLTFKWNQIAQSITYVGILVWILLFHLYWACRKGFNCQCSSTLLLLHCTCNHWFLSFFSNGLV